MPVSNHVSSGENGENRVSISGDSIKLTSDPTGKFFESFSISFWRKSDENTTYEFYLVGVRRIERLYENGLFYFDAFASIYFSLPVVGSNLGFTTGLKSKSLDVYASLRGDGLIFLPLLADEDDAELVPYRHIKPAIGLTYTLDTFTLSLEGSIIEYSKSYSDLDYFDSDFNNTYIVSLGVSYKL